MPFFIVKARKIDAANYFINSKWLISDALRVKIISKQLCLHKNNGEKKKNSPK